MAALVILFLVLLIIFVLCAVCGSSQKTGQGVEMKAPVADSGWNNEDAETRAVNAALTSGSGYGEAVSSRQRACAVRDTPSMTLLAFLGYDGAAERFTIEDSIREEYHVQESGKTEGVVDVSQMGFFDAIGEALKQGKQGKRINYDPLAYRQYKDGKNPAFGEKLRRIAETTEQACVEAASAAIFEFCTSGGWTSVAHSGFLCPRGDKLLCVSDEVSLYENRAVRVSHTTGRGISCSLGGGWRGSAHESHTTSRSHDELTFLGKGALYTTTRHLIYVGEGKTRTIRFDDVVSFKSNWKPSPAGIVSIATTKRTKEMQIEGCGLFFVSLMFWVHRDHDFMSMFLNAKTEFDNLKPNAAIAEGGAISKLRDHLVALANKYRETEH